MGNTLKILTLVYAIARATSSCCNYAVINHIIMLNEIFIIYARNYARKIILLAEGGSTHTTSFIERVDREIFNRELSLLNYAKESNIHEGN